MTERHQPAPAWAVFISKPSAAEVAATSVRKAGYRTYLPMETKILTGHRAGQREAVLRPLFQRYGFVELHPGQQWTPVLRSTGVQDLIWSGLRPALLADELIEALRQAENAGEFDRTRPGIRGFTAGQSVTVTDGGPFDGLIGRIVEVDRAELRIVVLLGEMGMRTAFSGAALEAVEG